MRFRELTPLAITNYHVEAWKRKTPNTIRQTMKLLINSSNQAPTKNKIKELHLIIYGRSQVEKDLYEEQINKILKGAITCLTKEYKN